MADCDLFLLIEPTANPSCCSDDRVDCDNSKLTGLDLSNRDIENLPPALLGFRDLESLNLENNNLNSIQTPLLFASPSIKTLSLAGNSEIKELPPALATNLQGLESVDLSGTGVTDVSSLAGLPELKEVVVSDPAALESASKLPGVTVR
jgi:Leucine-rich repeat (LRR) protein